RLREKTTRSTSIFSLNYARRHDRARRESAPWQTAQGRSPSRHRVDRTMIHADTPGRRSMIRRGVGHPSLSSAAALGLVLSASWSDPTFAIGLGQVTQQSALGQSLRIVVPVIVGPGEDIAAECFRL